MENKNRGIAIITELVIIIIIIVLLVFYAVIPNVSDLKYMRKAEAVQRDLKELRTALEEYYQENILNFQSPEPVII